MAAINPTIAKLYKATIMIHQNGYDVSSQDFEKEFGDDADAISSQLVSLGIVSQNLYGFHLTLDLEEIRTLECFRAMCDGMDFSQSPDLERLLFRYFTVGILTSKFFSMIPQTKEETKI